jgi:protein-S-isoprenylcysteine O-methyltransferase Ste14
MSFDTVILSSWAVFLLVWGIFAFGVKRDMRGGGFASVWSSAWPLRLLVALFLLAAAFRVEARARSRPTSIGRKAALFVPSAALGWTAAAIVVIGIGFAIWARVALGRNWSPRPSVKEHHELVTSGPYAYTRHPIYSGMLLAAFGSALTGSIYAIGVLVLASVLFLSRIPREEKIMLDLFPSAYPPYQARTKRLIPLLW